jgi:hypothetical protein
METHAGGASRGVLSKRKNPLMRVFFYGFGQSASGLEKTKKPQQCLFFIAPAIQRVVCARRR